MKKSKIFQVVTSIACSALLFACAACSDTTEQGETTGNSSEVLSVVQGEYLYANSISEYSILIRDDANYYENFAANELAQNLGVSTGHALPILTENELKKEDRVISLGHTSLWDKKVGVTLSESNIVESGYYITTVENNIYISCPDFTSSSGVLYGVYDFLYDTVGYEFFAEDEILIEKRTEIPLYDYKDVTVNPSFEMRMIRKAELRDDSITAMRYRMALVSFGTDTVRLRYISTRTLLVPAGLRAVVRGLLINSIIRIGLATTARRICSFAGRAVKCLKRLRQRSLSNSSSNILTQNILCSGKRII